MSCDRCNNTGLVGMAFCHCPAGARKSLDLGAKPKAAAVPSALDIAWAKKHGWVWDGKVFTPEPTIQVIVNPLPDNVRPGWCPWLAPIGALQTDSPFHSVRAALRVAEEIRQNRRLGLNEMNCAEEA